MQPRQDKSKSDMAEPGPRAQGVPAPPSPPAQAGQQVLQQQEQQAQPAQQGQQIIHLNWSHFKPDFWENLKKVQKLICFILTIG